jgi:phenylpropionate dioxygenase-like ring-hydroxylating dioxygenase large terminal subunit
MDMKRHNDYERSDGCAYGRAVHRHDAEITETGPGTPCGELMRRYWQPVAVSARVGTRPQRIRILAEDLIIFRDGRGRPGLITPRCAHRGADMYWGKVDDDGIRCCYHGWKFDVEGRCLDQPCEPQGGARKDRVRQPWYALEERYGLIWAYMGPPEKKPVLPRWDLLEDLAPDEKIAVDTSSLSAGGDADIEVAPWNWLQDWENTMDPFHTAILHSSFSGAQFSPDMAVMPNVSWVYTDLGMCYRAYRKLTDGRDVDRIVEVIFPNARSVPNVNLAAGRAHSIGWLVPVDDLNHRFFHCTRVPKAHAGVPMNTAPDFGGKRWSEMSDEEHYVTPGDWEAQYGQGRITLHSEEHLVTSDKGVAMLRRRLREQIGIVRQGGDPIGVVFDASQALIKVSAGNFYREAALESV